MSSGSKKLYRSVNDQIIAGVAGGLGEYLGVDSTLVRVIFALLAIMGGGGVVLYLILWIIVPLAPGAKPKLETTANSSAENESQTAPWSKPQRGNFRFWLGLLIIALGTLVLLDEIAPLPWLRWELFWPGVLILLGLLLLTGGRRAY